MNLNRRRILASASTDGGHLHEVKKQSSLAGFVGVWITLLFSSVVQAETTDDFLNPPDSAKPWVYWYFEDGNLTREGMAADLESMKEAGLGGAIYLEIGIGMPRGPVKFMSPQWQQLLGLAFVKADQLNLPLALASGPGWCGCGGPWIKPDQSMQHLVASETMVNGPITFSSVLPTAPPHMPFFGMESLNTELAKEYNSFYRDAFVLAFPTPAGKARIDNIDQKALYYRPSWSSDTRPVFDQKALISPFLTSPADLPAVPSDQCIDPDQIVDLSDKLTPDGHLNWTVPPGPWTILRFGRRLTGQTTRPAPDPGLGFETDKFSSQAMDTHFDSYIETLLHATGAPQSPGRGLTSLHFDSWEMSSQNWTANFPQEFMKRRGYDPLHFLPTFLGYIVRDSATSERFLWDLRQTAQELVVDTHMAELVKRGHDHGLELSLEPYDLDPCSDLKLGSIGDVPMGEFWSPNGFNTFFSCIEAASIGHTNGRPIIGAESFTAENHEDWHQYPGRMKDEGDWAFCCGINRFDFHRYSAQPTLTDFPGMTMGDIGVHWDRTETWWDMVPAYHLYISRCSQMLRRGLFVADVLYLAPEGAPQVFRPPSSAIVGTFPDRLGYNFDGCAPDTLINRASVKDGRIVFPDGMSYRLLVLPRFDTMTPQLLQKIDALVEAGATVVGAAPKKSPSLANYPQCDEEVRALAGKLWDGSAAPEHSVGQGLVIDDPPATWEGPNNVRRDIYPPYAFTAQVLAKLGVSPDFQSDGDVRYIHRKDGNTDLYFVASRKDQPQTATCQFRISGQQPEWWDPLTGQERDLPVFSEKDGMTSVAIRFDPHMSGFVIFRHPSGVAPSSGENFPQPKPVNTMHGPWSVSFDPQWGGPAQIVFDNLDDWILRPEEGIKHYSGKAVYQTTFDFHGSTDEGRFYISLGTVKNLARVKLNGQDLGIVWCDPWRVEIPAGTLLEGANNLEITVANLWVNRLIADSGLPEDKRLTKTSLNPFSPTSPLESSGLLGPVCLETRIK